MRRWSFTARLTMLFALILIACFIAVGVILFDALTDEIYAENDLSIVLACRHLRRLATEMQDVSEVREHQARLISLVLGDAAQALEVQTAAGEKLIDYNPPHVTLPILPATEPDQRIVVEHLSRWESDGVAGPGHCQFRATSRRHPDQDPRRPLDAGSRGHVAELSAIDLAH